MDGHELDKGTTVKIYLPAVETPVKEGVQKRLTAKWVMGTGTIIQRLFHRRTGTENPGCRR
jgi:hypothetical protein